MKKVYQNMFVFTHGTGNRFSAALASLLELDLAEVPNFVPVHNGQWLEACQEWLSSRNLTLLRIILPETFPVNHYEEGKEIRFRELNYPVLCIASGKSPRGSFHHSVVGNVFGLANFELLHDPHPEGNGLDGLPAYFDFILPLNPCEFSENK